MQHQTGEQRALLVRAQIDHGAVAQHLKPTQDPDLHIGSVGRRGTTRFLTEVRLYFDWNQK